MTRPGDNNPETQQFITRVAPHDFDIDDGHIEHVHLDTSDQLYGDVSDSSHRVHQFDGETDFRLNSRGSRRELFGSVVRRFAPTSEEFVSTELLADTLTQSVLLPSTDPVLETAPSEKVTDRGDIGRRGLLLGLAGLGVGYILLKDKWGSLFNFRSPDLTKPFTASPPVVTAEAMHKTIEIRGTFEMLAIADVSMGVEVEGFKEGLGIDFTGITDAEYKKDLWMRMALTTDNKQINDSLVVTRRGDELLGVKATLRVADIFMPHVNDFDFRNFISLRPGDSQEEIDRKIYEFVTENGKYYDKSGGFDCGACGTGAAELFRAASLAAVFAISVDGRQPDLVDRMTKTYQLNLQSQLAANYDLPLDKVVVDLAYDDGTNPLEPPTPEEVKAIYQKRLDDLYQENYAAIKIEHEGVEQLVDVGEVLFDVKPELRYNDDNEPFVYLQLHGGAEITIKLSGITLDEDIRMAIISNIEEFEEREVNNPSDNATTVTLPEVVQPSTSININGGVGSEKYGPPAPTSSPMYDQPPAPTVSDD